MNDLSTKLNRITVQGINNCANMIFKQAIKDRVIKNNPTTDVIIPKKQQTVEDIEKDEIAEKYLEHEELEEFLNAVQMFGMENDLEWFYLLAFSGMRSGELLALKWSDLNFETNEIRITKTLFNPKNNTRGYQLTPPKTKGSIRTILIEQEIMDLLKNLGRKKKKYKMQYRHEIEDFHDSDFVFTKFNGYPYTLSTLGGRMKRLLKFTRINKNATPHMFRHTHISMMAEAGIDLPTIMHRVGHEDINTTNKIYMHVTSKMKESASVKVRNIYQNVLSELF